MCQTTHEHDGLAQWWVRSSPLHGMVNAEGPAPDNLDLELRPVVKDCRIVVGGRGECKNQPCVEEMQKATSPLTHPGEMAVLFTQPTHRAP